MTGRLAVLASGGGRSFENLARAIAARQLDASLDLLLCDRDGIGALERAERLAVPSLVLPRAEFRTAEAFSQRAFVELAARAIDLVVLAGFLRLIVVPPDWIGRVINIHPALLPAYGGKGYYGDRVHRAVLENHEERSGCTVHFVDNEYDHGPVILQREVPVLAGDSVDELAARVFAEEKRALPEAIRLVLAREARFG